MSLVYDPNKIRTGALFPPPGPGTVVLTGFAPGAFVTPEYNTPDKLTYTKIDGLGVHTVARDTAGGLLRVRVQYASQITNVPLQNLANLQFADGGPKIIVRGIVTVVDANNGVTYICDDCALANSPIDEYADEQPIIEYVFRGTITTIRVMVPQLRLGPSAP